MGKPEACGDTEGVKQGGLLDLVQGFFYSNQNFLKGTFQ